MAETPSFWSDEFLVNTITDDFQATPVVAALESGGFVVVWVDSSTLGGDDSGLSVRAQLFDFLGQPVGGEFQVNTTLASQQNEPSVAALAGGGFVVTFSDFSQTGTDTDLHAIRARRFAEDGTPIDAQDFIVNTTTADSQSGPAVAGRPDGGFMVAYFDLQSGDIRVRRFDPDGFGETFDFIANTTTTDFQTGPDIASLPDGGFVVVWTDRSETGGDTDSWAVRGQVFDASAVKVGAEFLVNSTTDFVQNRPSVAVLTNGNFVVVFEDISPSSVDDSDGAIRAQIFSPTGTKVGSELLVNTLVNGSQSDANVTALADGGFFVTWTDYGENVGDISAGAIRGQRLDANGSKVGDEILINGTTFENQRIPSVSELADGRLIVAYEDHSQQSDPSQSGTLARILDPRDDIFFASDADENLASRLEGGTVAGGGGNDYLLGFEADDALLGVGGDDILEGAGGDDVLDGNAGFDVAVYASAWRDYLVAQDGNIGSIVDQRTGAPEGTDQLTGIDAIRFANGEFAYALALAQAPTSTPIPAKTATETIAFSFDASLHFSDANAPLGDELSYSLSGGPSWLTIGADTGVLSGTPGFSDAAPAQGVMIIATDIHGMTGTRTFQLTVGNTNRTPGALSLSNSSTTENVPAGTVVGTLSATDLDGDALTFSLVEDPSDRFAVVGTQLRVDGPLDFETAPLHSVTLRVSDDEGASFDKQFTVSVADTNEAPASIALSSAAVQENLLAGTVVGQLSATDPDGDALTFMLTSDPGGFFQIAGNELRLAKPLDFETAESHQVTIEALDRGGLNVAGSFTISVQDIVDLIRGDARDNKLVGAGGADDIRGLGGSDRLFGEDGSDTLSGGAGRDVLVGGSGADILKGGKGKDTASYQDATLGVLADLKNSDKNRGDATGDSYRSVENLTGSTFEDKLIGDDEANLIKGGKGNDKLHGGKGPDGLVGNGGADRFIFKALSDSSAGGKNRDTIVDFRRKQEDRIDLRAIDARDGKKNQAFDFIGKDAFSGRKGELRYEKRDAKTVVQGDVDGDGEADFALDIAKVLSLNEGDFML